MVGDGGVSGGGAFLCAERIFDRGDFDSGSGGKRAGSLGTDEIHDHALDADSAELSAVSGDQYSRGMVPDRSHAAVGESSAVWPEPDAFHAGVFYGGLES